MRRTLVVLTLIVAVAGCGSSKKTAKESAGSTTASTPARPAATTFAGGRTVRGSGYSLRLPAKWQDAKAALKGSAIRFDNAYVNSVAQGIPKENIVVIRESPPGVKDNQLGIVDKTFRGQAATLADSKGVEPSRAAKLDGAAAQTYAYVMRQGGGVGRQRQEFAIHGGAVYTITWTAPRRGFARSERLFDQILASWRWA